MTEADSPGVRVPPPLIYLSGLILGAALDRVLPWNWASGISGLSYLGPGTPWGLRLAIGIPIVLLGLALDAWAATAFRKAHTTILPWGRASFLVPNGPYRFTRNPMYLGMAISYLGLALAIGSWWALAILPIVLLVIARYVIAREERHLAARFGDAYASYRARVRRWL